MKLYAVIDRIEDNKIVVVNFVDKKGSMYLPKEIFDFEIYEGLWLIIEITPDENKTQEMKTKIISLQKKLLKQTRKKTSNE
ncbi:MAG: DUF3006 domain-containing protein [Endomicrobia bacterium]|nr:DUF3006 domain-containing protein [Endomicrobiia bacterium]